jgi:hypothetical protein
MRRLILGSMTAAALAFGVSTVAFAAPLPPPHNLGRPNSKTVHVQGADYYWNHHRYHHRDWDRNHHHWHYYD